MLQSVAQPLDLLNPPINVLLDRIIHILIHIHQINALETAWPIDKIAFALIDILMVHLWDMILH